MDQPIPFHTFVKKVAPLRVSQKPLPPPPSNQYGRRRASSVYSQTRASFSASMLPNSDSGDSLLTPIFLHPTALSHSASSLPEPQSEPLPLLQPSVYKLAGARTIVTPPRPETYLHNAEYAPSMEVFATSPPHSPFDYIEWTDDPLLPLLPHEELEPLEPESDSSPEDRGRSRRPRSLVLAHDQGGGTRISSGSASRTPRNRGRVQMRDFAIPRVARSNSPLHGPMRTREHPPYAMYSDPVSRDASPSSSGSESPIDLDAVFDASSDYHCILTEAYRREREQDQHAHELEGLLASGSASGPKHKHAAATGLPFASFQRAHRKTLSTASTILSLRTKTRQLNAEPTAAQRMRAAIPIQIPSVRRKFGTARTRASPTPPSSAHSMVSNGGSAAYPVSEMAYMALGPMETLPARTPELQRLPRSTGSKSSRGRVTAGTAGDRTRQHAFYPKGSSLASVGGTVSSRIRALGQAGVSEEAKQERRREELKRTIKLVDGVDPRSVSFNVSDLPAAALDHGGY